MGHSVKFNQDVVVVKNGIIDCNNVNVKGDLIGMVALVFNVWMEKIGIKIRKYASVKMEPNGMVSFVLLFKAVMEEWCGIKIHGPVNVHQLQFGKMGIVLQTHVQMEEYGTNDFQGAFVLLEKSG